VETRTLGTSGPAVSLVGLGCNNFGRRIDASRSREVVDAALDAGITFFDTADVYGQGQSEEYLAAALGDRRSDVVIATKFGLDMGDRAAADGPRGTRAYARAALEASLRRLKTDVVDVLYYHRPDGVTPIGETLDAMAELVNEGKVRYIAVSNFDEAQITDAVEHLQSSAGLPIVALQNEYSLLHRDPEDGLLDACARLGVGFVPYFPLASGLLTGKYRAGAEHPSGTRITADDERAADANLQRVEELVRFAEERRHSVLELAIGALASRPSVASIISGATRADQVRSNAEAAGAWALDASELAALDAVGV
jgi:aryl-alcohol dehydrogenase-like predicted oxidoreductase